jgi:hypothetical protein
MTAYVGTLDTSMALAGPINPGSSNAAEIVERALAAGLQHYSEPRVDWIVSEITQMMSEPIETPSRSILVDEQTASTAIQFARLLPWSLPTPEVAPEADGEISFDWLGPSRKMFSVSVNRTGRIAYAGRFGERSKVHGTEQLSEMCPREITQGIARATR